MGTAQVAAASRSIIFFIILIFINIFLLEEKKIRPLLRLHSLKSDKCVAPVKKTRYEDVNRYLKAFYTQVQHV